MKNIFLLIMIIVLFGCGNNDKNKTEETPVANINGEQLFNDNCASCHKCEADFTGPAMKGALQRWGGDKALMYEFIKSPFSVIQKSEYAKNLQQKFGGAIMTPSTLSDKEIDAVLNYCGTSAQAAGK